MQKHIIQAQIIIQKYVGNQAEKAYNYKGKLKMILNCTYLLTK